MNKFLRVLCVLAVSAVVFSGCKDTKSFANNTVAETSVETKNTDVATEYSETENVNDAQITDELRPYDFSVQYIRAGGHDGEYPDVKIMHSVDELESYLHSLIYTNEELLNACKKYNYEYFEKQPLLMVLLEEGSGSIRHEVKGVYAESENVSVEIETIVPEVGTCDMAYWHILIEPECGIEIGEEDEVTVLLDGVNITEKLTNVYYSKGNANISLMLKEGWEYSIEDNAGVDDFSVSVYPEGKSQHKLRIDYSNGIGICGTGLRFDKINIGKYNCDMCTYDNRAMWDFIIIQDTFGEYVIFNDGVENWWSEYGDEAMEILSTLTVGEGYVSRNQAVQIAKDKADSDVEYPEVEFDYDKSVWKVTLEGKNTEAEDTFIIDVYGNIIEIIE